MCLSFGSPSGASKGRNSYATLPLILVKVFISQLLSRSQGAAGRSPALEECPNLAGFGFFFPKFLSPINLSLRLKSSAGKGIMVMKGCCSLTDLEGST